MICVCYAHLLNIHVNIRKINKLLNIFCQITLNTNKDSIGRNPPAMG